MDHFPTALKTAVTEVMHKLFIIDSGATNHCFVNRGFFVETTLKKYTGLPILGIGNIKLMPSYLVQRGYPLPDKHTSVTFEHDTVSCTLRGKRLFDAAPHLGRFVLNRKPCQRGFSSSFLFGTTCSYDMRG